MQQSNPDTLPNDREYLMERRRLIVQELGFIERRLGLPSSLVPKDERRREAYEQRVRDNLKREG